MGFADAPRVFMRPLLVKSRIKAMIPITRYPSYVEKYAPYFQEFFSKPQYKHFKEYLSGLVLVENPSVSNISEQLVEGSDQSSLNRFLTVAGWAEEPVNERRMGLAKKEGVKSKRWRGSNYR
jgi:hypothetical protein